MDSPLIQLHPDGSARWRAAGQTQRGTLAQAAALARARRVILLVPGESVLLARVRIPSRSSSEIQRALPYALEDWLLQAPETQHFAWARSDGDIAAAVVSASLLQAWVAACAEAGIEPEAIVPDVLALPWQPGQWTLLLAGERALLRNGPLDGFACTRALLPTLLAAAWQRCAEAARPRTLQVLRGDGELPTLPAELTVQESTAAVDPLVLLQTPSLALNLRSGRHAARHTRDNGPWRWLAAAAALALVTALAYSGTRYVILGREQALLQQGVDTLFHRVLPAQQRIVDARAQLAEALLSAQRKVGGGGALSLLAQTTLPLTNMPGARVQRLDYANGRLQLALTLPRPADYAALRRQLDGQGLRVALMPPPAQPAGASALLRVSSVGAP